MKSKFLYLLVFVGFLVPTGLNSLSAADSQGINPPDRQIETDVQKSRLGNGGEGEGEGQGGEGGENEQEKKKAKEVEKAKLAKTEDSSFGMLKDLFQSTFDYFYAPDSTKSGEIVRQKN